ncbi:MAG: hypothetical protein ACFFA3_18475 [Promethearchaeota archaeon]
MRFLSIKNVGISGPLLTDGIRRDFEGINKPKERKKKDYEGLVESYTEGTSK